jgi:hypothetical protein
VRNVSIGPSGVAMSTNRSFIVSSPEINSQPR